MTAEADCCSGPDHSWAARQIQGQDVSARSAEHLADASGDRNLPKVRENADAVLLRIPSVTDPPNNDSVALFTGTE